MWQYTSIRILAAIGTCLAFLSKLVIPAFSHDLGKYIVLFFQAGSVSKRGASCQLVSLLAGASSLNDVDRITFSSSMWHTTWQRGEHINTCNAQSLSSHGGKILKLALGLLARLKLEKSPHINLSPTALGTPVSFSVSSSVYQNDQSPNQDDHLKHKSVITEADLNPTFNLTSNIQFQNHLVRNMQYIANLKCITFVLH